MRVPFRPDSRISPTASCVRLERGSATDGNNSMQAPMPCLPAKGFTILPLAPTGYPLTMRCFRRVLPVDKKAIRSDSNGNSSASAISMTMGLWPTTRTRVRADSSTVASIAGRCSISKFIETEISRIFLSMDTHGAFDVIIVGLGANGSSALCHLSRAGKKVLGIDRFHPPHHKGSSHGESRIIRQAYHENPLYVPRGKAAYPLGEERAAIAGKPLFLQTGGLLLGHE